MLETQQPVPAIEGHADRVEADLPRGRTAFAVLAQPRRREAAQPRPLTGAKPLQRILPIPGPAPRPPCACPGSLDLHERQHTPVIHDQIDLAMASASVSRQHRKTQANEVRRGDLLTESTKGMARIPAHAARTRIGPGTRRLNNRHETNAKSPPVTAGRDSCRNGVQDVSKLGRVSRIAVLWRFAHDHTSKPEATRCTI
jgi:hypothetical protein